MNDLLQRLRDREAHTHNMQYQETYPTIKLCEEAADEIERLRTALEKYGRHKPRTGGSDGDIGCEANRLEPPDYIRLGKCTCGFSEALRINK